MLEPKLQWSVDGHNAKIALTELAEQLETKSKEDARNTRQVRTSN